MTETADVSNGDCTNEAHAAILVQHDVGGWLAGVVASVPSGLGSIDALMAGRPDSWEADAVRQLVKGTVGWDDDYLADYKAPLP